MNITLKREIYKSKAMNIYSTLKVEKPKEIKSGNNSNISVANMPLLIISPQFNLEGYDKSRSLFVFESIFDDIRDFFKEALDWFTNPDMQDLFYLDEGNELQFNYDYKELKTTLRVGTFTIQNAIIRPVRIVFNNGISEGINLTVNNEVNTISITLKELRKICKILDGFNFQSEWLILQKTLDMALAYGTQTVSGKFNNSTGSYSQTNPFGV